MAVVVVDIMDIYKQFRHMNAYYFTPDKSTIFFKSYDTEIFYMCVEPAPYFSFLEYTDTTTQKQLTTFLRSNLLDSIADGLNIEKFYKTCLKWARVNGFRGRRVNVNIYPWYMILAVENRFFRVSYDGKTLKELYKEV